MVFLAFSFVPITNHNFLKLVPTSVFIYSGSKFFSYKYLLVTISFKTNKQYKYMEAIWGQHSKDTFCIFYALDEIVLIW